MNVTALYWKGPAGQKESSLVNILSHLSSEKLQILTLQLILNCDRLLPLPTTKLVNLNCDLCVTSLFS